MSAQRYDRGIRLFGEEGQAKLRRTTVAVAGVGGLGSPVALHLALLGVRRVYLIDDDDLDETSRNRFIGARDADPAGSPKVELAARLIRETNSQVEGITIYKGLISEEAFDAIRASDWVFGCFDHDGPRAVLNELCAAYTKPYIDLASDVPEPGVYGGRICVATGGQGCLECMDQLERRDVRRYLASDEERRQEDAIYGITRDALGETGPAVVTINGVVAALGATEFMVAVTGLRQPVRLINYRGHQGKTSASADRMVACPICNGVYGRGAAADVERYLRIPYLRRGARR